MASPGGSAVRHRAKPPNTPPPSAATTTKPAPKHQPPPPFALPPRFAFALLLASHTLAALYHPLQDCDEVFNYWEPTHYLTHGHGLQTWEYSPTYAIRSWAYIALHALPTLPLRLLGGSKKAEFYFLRILLGALCALCETRLFAKIAAVLNPRVALTFVLILATSPGLFHASIAFLPSSFAMYFTSLGFAAFMDWRGGLRTAQGIWMFAIASTLGWPFAAALSLPFLLEELALGWLSDRRGRTQLCFRVLDGLVRSLLTLAAQVGLDSFFYKKWTVVPANIVLYNVFARTGGPALYGTEPWPFYLRNLALNFHLWLPLALLSIPLVLAQHRFRTAGAHTKSSPLRALVFLTPFYLWLAIFTLQPHKEERFMYPAYPALALNAAVALHILLANLTTTNPRHLIARLPLQLRLAAALAFLLAALALSAFRTLGTITAYAAPLTVYNPLHAPGASRADDWLCLSKEWYRFPSHYHLPPTVRAKFIKSAFAGLLPGEFSEAQTGFGLFPGTWLAPPGMNDGNREDPGKYVDVRRCAFMVDSGLASAAVTALEPRYVGDGARWERVGCAGFLDAGSTGVLGRLGWVPDWGFLPVGVRRVWGEYCLLKRRGEEEVGREGLGGAGGLGDGVVVED
ncbi:hypothetical protein LTR08_005851 [Meristemomyces frigidus]|nr:hypothetical protein LTR08_005851 [Meristemomyces frigidus]